MKTLLTVLLFLLFANLTSLRAAYDDWTDAKLPFTDGMIENVSLIDGMNGIACGLNITGRKHMILQTSDGGDTWSIVDLSSVADFEPFNIYQKDVNTWFAVGQNANQNSDDYNKIMIIKTTDQGVSWTKMNLPDLKGYISAICFSSDNKGVITGDFNNGENPIILYTNDGGANWQEANFKQETYQRARHPFFIDENNGWVVLNSYKIGIKLLKTTDGGANWTEISNPVNEKGIFSGVYFVDENIGWIYGLITEGKRHGFLYVTKDGGMSWHNVDLRIPNGNGNETVGLDEVAIFSFIVSPTEEDDIYSGYLSAQSMDFRNEYTIITNITLDNSNVMMSKKNYNSRLISEDEFGATVFSDYELFMSCFDNNDEINMFAYGNKVNDSHYKAALKKIKIEKNVSGLKQKDDNESLPGMTVKNNVNYSTATVEYNIPGNARVVMKIYSLAGEQVMTLCDEYKSAGNYTIRIGNGELESGVYFIRMQADNFVATEKLIIVK
jgi:photosystem II stability/assembly factor-like uncharacterized protein